VVTGLVAVVVVLVALTGALTGSTFFTVFTS